MRIILSIILTIASLGLNAQIRYIELVSESDISDRTLDLKTQSGNISIASGNPLNPNIADSSFIDSRDGKAYKMINIGEQWWMAENLAYLPSVSPSSEESRTSSYYYVFDYQGSSVNEAKVKSNYQTYGVLYNWPAAVIACPEGWHLPSDAEWKQLEMYLGMSQADSDDDGLRGINEGSMLAGNSGLWKDGSLVNDTAFGTSAFMTHPGGHRDHGGTFWGFGSAADFWSSTEDDASNAWGRLLDYYYSNMVRLSYYKDNGFSARCIKD